MRVGSVGALAFAAAAMLASSAAHSGDAAKPVLLRQGEEGVFPISIADGRVVVGAPLIGKQGLAHPKDGELVVGIIRGEKNAAYSMVVFEAKTTAPIDLVATGFVGSIKIDELFLCGRADGTATHRIGAASWRIGIGGFEVHREGAGCL